MLKPFEQTFNKALSYITVGLTVAMLLVFLVYPVSVILVKAFFGPHGFTLSYFGLFFDNKVLTHSLLNSLLIGFGVMVGCTILVLPLALIQARCQFWGKGILSGLLLVPMVMPPFVGAIGFQRFFARRGSVNLWLMDWGIISKPIDFLGDEHMLWMVILLEVLHLYPIMYLNLTAALANIDPALEEMATTIGVPRWRQYLDIVWPLARPGYFAGAIIVFIWGLTDLGTPLLVGFHETLPVQIFHMVSDVNENPMGYALVFIVVVVTVGAFLIPKWLMNPDKYQMISKGHRGQGLKSLSLGPTALVFLLFLGVTFVALIPHISVMVTALSHKWFMTPLPEEYTLSHFKEVFGSELSLRGIQNSFLFASLATLLDVVLGLMIAYVVVRKLIPMAGLLDALAMVPLALPGIVLAFGYVVGFAQTPLDPFDNPVILLIVAYGIRRLPFMVRSATAGLQQTNVSLEEASLTFGASRFATLRRITIPLVSANLLAGSLLAFSYAMLDVSDSLILAMRDAYYPLTKAIYVLFLEYGEGEFLASALGMIGMLILALCLVGASLILGKKMGELFRS